MADRLRRASPEQRREWDRAICQRLLAQPRYLDALSIHCYLALPGEAATEPIVRAALAGGKQVAVPVVGPEDHRLLCARIDDYDRDLAPGYRGILEPPPGSRRLVDPEQINFYIVPGVAFDPRGFRLGRGLGYYDRCLAGVKGRATICALAYELQVVDALPGEPHDVRVDLIVTEARVIEAKGKRYARTSHRR
jgi:5-formyltetrahydrofolate cyclo-ligase